MNGNFIHKLNTQIINKQFIFSLIFLFLAAPFLFSCGGGGADDGMNDANSQTDH